MRSPVPDNQSRKRVHRGSVPLWLAAAILAPLGLLFLVSLAVALAGGALVMLVLPFFWRLRARRSADQADIELDRSEYRHIESDALPPRERR